LVKNELIPQIPTLALIEARDARIVQLLRLLGSIFGVSLASGASITLYRGDELCSVEGIGKVATPAGLKSLGDL